MDYQLKELRALLEKLWSQDTAYTNTDDTILTYGTKSNGQCYVTALLLNKLAGGEILVNTEYKHYWNKINGIEIDLTSDQFKGGDGIHPVFESSYYITKHINWKNKRFQVLWNRFILLLESLVCPICKATTSTYCKPFTKRGLKMHIRNSHFPRPEGWNKKGGLT